MKEPKATAEIDRISGAVLTAGQVREASPSTDSGSEWGAAESAQRVVIFAPFGRDGALLQHALEQVNLPAAICPDSQCFYQELERGAGAVLLTMEALKEMRIERFEQILAQQPPWSDIPVILLVSSDVTTEMEQMADRLGNVTVLGRTVRPRALVAAVGAALRARRRQFEVRDLLWRSEMQQTHIAALNARLQRSMIETHHRVKNNLQIIAAMIDMQVMEGAEFVPTREIQRLGSQVRTLAVVHDLLTENAKKDGQAQYVSARSVLEKLVPLLQDTTPERCIRIALDDAELPTRQGTSLALIANELISNALKHGNGDVEMSLHANSREIALEVSDQGPGFPRDFDIRRVETTGLTLVENLSRWDMSGAVRYENKPEGGARVTVTIHRELPPRGSAESAAIGA